MFVSVFAWICERIFVSFNWNLIRVIYCSKNEKNKFINVVASYLRRITETKLRISSILLNVLQWQTTSCDQSQSSGNLGFVFEFI